ncbi:hypothetical protein H6CHR_01387 [Variovorax sp. PBL-H6]|nr:hypothetical protein H6CHR_01387 [Variovorax sp. PBL-H6]
MKKSMPTSSRTGSNEIACGAHASKKARRELGFFVELSSAPSSRDVELQAVRIQPSSGSMAAGNP